MLSKSKSRGTYGNGMQIYAHGDTAAATTNPPIARSDRVILYAVSLSSITDSEWRLGWRGAEDEPKTHRRRLRQTGRWMMMIRAKAGRAFPRIISCCHHHTTTC
jgi:hypothetical protein